MKTAIFVQARMDSKRLPGKMMMPVAGKPLLQHVVERLQLCARIKNVTILTSDEVTDDPIADWCRYHSVEFFRGPLDDVYGRFVEAVEFYQLDAFVRISGDSPLIDARLVDELVEVFNTGSYDLVTNVMPRSFPRGESVEVLRVSMFKAKADFITDPQEREHVTAYYYRNPSEFRIKNVSNPRGDFSSKYLCVDTAEDLEKLKQVVEYFGGAVGGHPWQECLAAIEPGEVKHA